MSLEPVVLDVLPKFDPVSFGIAKPRELALTFGVRTDLDGRDLYATLLERCDNGVEVVDAVVDDVPFASTGSPGMIAKTRCCRCSGSLSSRKYSSV
jgi:hypothetical protein